MNVIRVTNKLDEHLIRYTISYACNFNCKDCYQENKRLQNKYKVTKELITGISKKINDLIESVPNDNKPITLYPEGGEISLWNLTDDVLKNITSRRLTGLKIVSNFSADIEWYKKLVNYCKSNNLELRILLSYHHNQMPIESFKSKLLELNQLHPPKVLVVVDNENYREHVDILEFLKTNNIKFNLNFKKYGKPATEEVHNFILSYMNNSEDSKNFTVDFDDGSRINCSGETLRLEGLFKPAGYYCDNNKNYDILPDGTVKHFGCPMIKTSFNLLNDEINYDSSIILCNRTEERPCNISCQNHNIWK